MLPLDAITNDNVVNNPSQLAAQLSQLKSVANVDGVMTDVWWGLVEQEPMDYNWSAYEQLVKIVQQANLKIKVIMSFHQCGGNVGDTCDIPLPSWVLAVGNSNPDIFYTDREGNRDHEYLSSGVDNATIFPPNSRTAVQMYSDYMSSFASNFKQYFGSVITEVQIGLGPAGEMRYPSYQTNLWTFCGIGEFQMYDRYLLEDLAAAATAAGHSNWGLSGPSNAGTYNNAPQQTGFFSNGNDNYQSQYGQFFLNWYANTLIQHGASVLSEAQAIFGQYKTIAIAGKVAGIHWLYKDPSHAAELTAGYKNDLGNGYTPILQMFKKYGAMLDFTCLEMKDSQMPASCECGPEELIFQTLTNAQQVGIGYEGENALPVYDTASYTQIEYESDRVFPIQGFDYLRLDANLLQSGNLQTFATFVQNMHTLL